MICSCGKQLERVPNWMANVNITFICANCPNRELQSIAEVKLVPEGTEPIKKKKSATK
jgi:hypothetical protein